MRVSRRLALASASALLAIGSIALPAAAANPLIAVVQGMPGKVVDVCLNNTEIKSGLRYGGWTQKVVAPALYTLRFRTASAGRCKGTVLAKTVLAISADQDVTFVGKSKGEKFVWFHNTDVPKPVGDVDWVAWRHAADVGPVALNVWLIGMAVPTAVPTFDVLDEWRQTFGGPFSAGHTFSVFKPGGLEPFLGPKQYLTTSGRRHEIYLVGTTTKNARFVLVARPTIAP